MKVSEFSFPDESIRINLNVMFINHVIYSLIEMRGNFVLHIFLKNKTGKGVSFLLSTSLIIKKEVHCDFTIIDTASNFADILL